MQQHLSATLALTSLTIEVASLQYTYTLEWSLDRFTGYDISTNLIIIKNVEERFCFSNHWIFLLYKLVVQYIVQCEHPCYHF